MYNLPSQKSGFGVPRPIQGLEAKGRNREGLEEEERGWKGSDDKMECGGKGGGDV